MSKYNFQEWLNQKISDDPEVILAGKLEYLRLYLTDAMRELRTKAGLTQAQLAEKLGVKQAAVSKLESALKDHELESVLHYLHQLSADLLVAVKQGEELYQVSDNEDVLLVDVPQEVAQLAEEKGMSLRQYVQEAIRHFSQKSILVIESHPDVATILNNLAALYNSQGRYTEAEPLYLQALELNKKLLGTEHPDIATNLNNLAGLYDSQGRYTEAEPLYLQALELTKQLLGTEHPDIATNLNNLAGLYDSQGRYSEAEPLYLQALELCKRVLGVSHPNTITIRNNLAILRKKRSTRSSGWQS